MDKDYYKILGVQESDSTDAIKSAYRNLARKWHPDIAGNSADTLKMFKEINEAYEILSNKTKREEYNRARQFYNYAKQGSESINKNNTYKNAEQNKSKNCSSKSFKDFSFNFENIFYKQRFNQNNKTEKITPTRGEDINTEIEITIQEAIGGVEKIINMLQTTTCPKCEGRKFTNGAVCKHCKGSGVTSQHKKFTVKIPAGIKNGAKIRLAHEGGAGINGGANGDLYICIHIKLDSDYKTEGLNIIKRVFLAPHEAVLGTNLDIKTINGNYSVKIAPNTQNGQKIRLSGCGIVQNDKIGDMIIVIEIRIPRSLSQEEIKLYERLSNISSYNVRDSIYE